MYYDKHFYEYEYEYTSIGASLVYYYLCRKNLTDRNKIKDHFISNMFGIYLFQLLDMIALDILKSEKCVSSTFPRQLCVIAKHVLCSIHRSSFSGINCLHLSYGLKHEHFHISVYLARTLFLNCYLVILTLTS